MKDEISIKRVVERDWSYLLRLEQEAESETYIAFTNEKDLRDFLTDSDAFVVMIGDDRVGYCSYEIVDVKRVKLNGLIVDKAYRMKGIGTKAVEHILSKIEGREIVYLETHPKNIPAIKLYLNLGFEISGWINNFMDTGEPRLKLIKRLK